MRLEGLLKTSPTTQFWDDSVFGYADLSASGLSMATFFEINDKNLARLGRTQLGHPLVTAASFARFIHVHPKTSTRTVITASDLAHVPYVPPRSSSSSTAVTTESCSARRRRRRYIHQRTCEGSPESPVDFPVVYVLAYAPMTRGRDNDVNYTTRDLDRFAEEAARNDDNQNPASSQAEVMILLVKSDINYVVSMPTFNPLNKTGCNRIVIADRYTEVARASIFAILDKAEYDLPSPPSGE
ncbi:hypothetical protein LZ31DRAFT_590839 [Colletotrichum somersetense]|nr:hypothetical protein LZ31DRAFT_590839 [Colletotrichum somersetense]